MLLRLKRLVHEERLNHGLELFGDKQGLAFVEAAIEHLQLDIDIRGESQVPTDDRFLVVANHPLGGLDSLALLSVIGKTKPNLQFLANDLLLSIDDLKDLFLPVNKHGSNRANSKRYRQAFASDSTLLHFPAGLCSRRQHGQIRDLPWQKSFVGIAQRYSRSILPYISKAPTLIASIGWPASDSA